VLGELHGPYQGITSWSLAHAHPTPRRPARLAGRGKLVAMRDKLEAQLEYLRSDERLCERARVARKMSPRERLAVAYDLSRRAAEMMARQSPELRARHEASRERPDAEAADCLRRLGHAGW
jgi:hypothetical protein